MLFIFVLIGNLLAGDVGDIEDMIADGQHRKAIEALNRHSGRLENPKILLSRQERLHHWLNLGMAYMGDDQSGKAIRAWEKALVIDPEVGMPAGLDADSAASWLQARKRVDDLSSFPLILPENTHFFDHYVDGLLIKTSVSLKKGSHFFQIRCGNGGLKSKKVQWPASISWREMCGLPPVALLHTTHSTLARDPEAAKRRLLGVALLTAGSAMLLTAAGMHQLWLSPLHEEILTARLNPAKLNREEGDALTTSFIAAQSFTLSVAVGGVISLGVGGAMQWSGGESSQPD